MKPSSSISLTAPKSRCSLPWRIVRPYVAMLLALGMAPVLAQSSATSTIRPANPSAAKPAVTVELTQAKVIQGPDGKEQFVDAATVKPGDLLEYRATYTNRDSVAINGLAVDLPIPEGLEYQAGSAKPGAPQVQAATKDGKFAAEPLVQKIADKTAPVPYEDYRALRWNLGRFPAGAQAMVSARVKVQTYVAPSTAVPTAGTTALPNAPPASVTRASAVFPAKP
jgi:uncharacterized repeat protein (TIGR01451 family)